MILYDDLVNKFKRIVRKTNFSDQFKKIIKRCQRVGYKNVSEYNQEIPQSNTAEQHTLL